MILLSSAAPLSSSPLGSLSPAGSLSPVVSLSSAGSLSPVVSPSPTATTSGTVTPGFGPSPGDSADGASAGLDAFLIVLGLIAFTVVIFIAMNRSLRRMRHNLGGSVLPRREADSLPVRGDGAPPAEPPATPPVVPPAAPPA
jgi:hypothetical protein